MYMCVSFFVCSYVCMYVCLCLFVCMYVSMYQCIYVSMYVCKYIYIYLDICISICINTTIYEATVIPYRERQMGSEGARNNLHHVCTLTYIYTDTHVGMCIYGHIDIHYVYIYVCLTVFYRFVCMYTEEQGISSTKVSTWEEILTCGVKLWHRKLCNRIE